VIVMLQIADFLIAPAAKFDRNRSEFVENTTKRGSWDLFGTHVYLLIVLCSAVGCCRQMTVARCCATCQTR